MLVQRTACLLTVLLLVNAPFLVWGQAERADPAALGFMPDRLQRVDSLFASYVEADQIAGAISLVMRHGAIAHFETYGMMDRENGTPMRPDAIFRIASMSKAVTSVAVMMLYEEGHFLLSDPVHHFIPEFREPRVAVAKEEGEGYALEPARQPITIQHLLTHTAGLTYGSGLASEAYEQADLQGWYFADRPDSIGVYIRQLAGLPLHAHPGEAWQYGYSTDVLGYLVEVVSGRPLDVFFRERIFEPLGMEDTHFFLPPEKADRLAPVYGLNEDGQLYLVESNAESDYLHGPRLCFSGGAGLLSTARDYGRFLQMLLEGGILQGKRILSPKTVELMRANHTGDLFAWGDEGFGLGFAVIEDIGVYGEVGSVGAYRWGSAYYPIYWVDPKEELIGLFLTQLRPAQGLPLRDRFRPMVYFSLLPEGYKP